ncbi:MAG: hypothetical protein IJK97_00035 [Thermoguttaceae bacterium]|nr:hypothetical protein [Thermoguttaceae bacterium]
MNSITAPYIRYGRFTSENMGGNDQYGVLESSPDFPEDARGLLVRRVVQSFQWTNGSIDVYPDSFLFWRLDEERFLFARLSDGGKDSRNRPHSVRILAVLLANSQFENLPEELAALANSSVWSEPADCLLTLQNTGSNSLTLAGNLEAALASGKRTILILRHPFVQKAEGVFEINDFAESDFPKPISAYTPQYPVPTVCQSPTSSFKEDNPMNKPLIYILLFLLILSVGNNIFLSRRISSISKQVTENVSQIAEAKKTLAENFQTQINEINEGLETQTQNLDALDKTVKELSRKQLTKEDFESKFQGIQEKIGKMEEEIKKIKENIKSAPSKPEGDYETNDEKSEAVPSQTEDLTNSPHPNPAGGKVTTQENRTVTPFPKEVNKSEIPDDVKKAVGSSRFNATFN